VTAKDAVPSRPESPAIPIIPIPEPQIAARGVRSSISEDTANLANVARRGIEPASQIVAASSTVPRFRWSLMVNGGGAS
jgi:hypothetical protein